MTHLHLLKHSKTIFNEKAVDFFLTLNNFFLNIKKKLI